MIRFLKSIQSRLILLVILVALPGLIGLIYESIIERKNAIDFALTRAINTVDMTTDFQTHLVDDTEYFLKNLSTFDAVLDPDSPTCSDFLADVLKINNNYINIGIPDVNGELLCNAKPITQTINVMDRPYFQKALATRSFSIGTFQIDRMTGVSSINFAYPVINPENNEIAGVAVAVISLEWWNKHLAESRLPDNTVAYITDSNENIIATYPNNLQLLGTPIAGVENTLEQYHSSLNTPSGTIIPVHDNLRVFVKRPLFRDSDLISIIVGVPFNEQLTAINARLVKSGITLLALILLMMFIASWGIKKTLLTPLGNLIQSIKNLELGKAIGATPPLGSSELIELQQRFTAMANIRLNAENELRKSQQSLQASERVLLSHIENTPLGCITWDKNLVCTQWNRSAEKIFGYTEKEAVGKHASELIIVPSMKTELANLFQLLIEDKGGQYNSNENCRKDGSIIICEWHSTPIVDENGVTIGVTSLVQDVTKNKQLEERLKLSASVFSHAREGIIITDAKGNIIEVNDTFANITGYDREEVLGKNPSLLRSDRQSNEFYAQLWQSLIDNGYWSGEIWNQRKNKEVYPQLLTISSVHDNNGNLKNYIAIFTDISNVKEQQQKLEQMAHYDVLTNLPNRALLADRLNQVLIQNNANNTQVAVILLDLDGFKEINDDYGHNVGDELLVAIAERLKTSIREGDTLSRFGGDEFVAVLSNLTSLNEFKTIVERMLVLASEPVICQGHKLKVSTSIGVTLYPADNTDADQLIRHADQAMYVAKQKGKNCYHQFDIQSEDAIKIRHETIQNITKALNNREFVLYYQPKVNMRTGEIIGTEALIRWQHPTRGLLSPAEFLPFIENHQLSIDIGEWVIAESLQQLGRWKKSDLNIQVSVNVGALQLQQQNFSTRLKSLLAAAPNISPSSLELEVLETSKLGDVKDVSKIMEDCVKLGVNFAIDDFGTGYSSLTYLRRLPANVIKIDQTFVRDMLYDNEDRTIVIGVIALARSFNRCVIAEGVETIAHGTALLKLGCELAQGYGIAKPMPADELPDWAKQWTTAPEWKNSAIHKRP
jgi:diguanylate cyclase (GGDEF)-like protein/PAS domain S-box-containing protein